tara:strand:+ start:1654 stop:2304 length:651 start_codon:yes stop_codon:yes gene_type:complete
MSIPRIGSGIGALTPEVWESMATAARQAAAAGGTPSDKLQRDQMPLAGHWNLAGTFLAQLTSHAIISGENFRWSYSWTHFVPFVNDSAYFNIGQQPATPSDDNTQNGEIVQPFNNMVGSHTSKNHVLSADGSSTLPAAYNLAEWNNTATYANGMDMDAASWPPNFEPQPIFETGVAAKKPLVVMHWTRYIYKETGNFRSRILFFFDRQNHFDGACP